MVLVWRITDYSPNSTNFPLTKHSHYMAHTYSYYSTNTFMLWRIFGVKLSSIGSFTLLLHPFKSVLRSENSLTGSHFSNSNCFRVTSVILSSEYSAITLILVGDLFWGGFPQWSALGPLLFIIYVNDVLLQIQNGSLMQFADDTYISDLLWWWSYTG